MMSLVRSVSKVPKICSAIQSRTVSTFSPPASLSIEDVKREVGEIGGGSVDFKVMGEGYAEV